MDRGWRPHHSQESQSPQRRICSQNAHSILNQSKIQRGERVASGIYLCQFTYRSLEASDGIIVRHGKMSLVQ
jgi:hypothetical protein